MKHLLLFSTLLMGSSSFANCPVGVRMIDDYGGKFEPKALQLIQEELAPKGYDVFETTYSDTDTDLIIEVLSAGISGGSSNAVSFTLGYTFDARFESTRSKVILAQSNKKKRAFIPYLTDVSERKREKLFLKVTREVLAKIKSCDQLKAASPSTATNPSTGPNE